MEAMTSNRTVTALFTDRTEATQAVEDLVAAGISRSNIRISPETDVSVRTDDRTPYDTTRDEKGFWASLADLFMPEDDRHTYAEAMHRGNVMVSVFVSEAEADRAEDILEREGTINVDESVESWRKEGWTGYAAPAEGSVATQGGEKSTQVVPEVEERLRVGKRQVGAGRVKVRSYVVETPVSEAVNLHSETVEVERRPVDRGVEATDQAFKERTIEAQATSEEAVVSKEARVTGEVLIRKEGTDRTEAIEDTVRSTKVEVEDDTASKKDRRP